MIKIKTLLFFFALLALQACFVGQGYKGNGNVIKQQIQTSDYTKISALGAVDIILTDGKVGDLSIEAESNLIGLVEAEVNNGELQIKTKDGVNISTDKGIKVYVPVDNRLSFVSAAGSGDITATKDLNSPDFTVQASGSGDIDLGNIQAGNFHIKLMGSGNFSSENLQSGNTDISVSGSGNVALTGKTTGLIIKLNGSSEIKAPNFIADSADVSISGSGDITLNVQKTLSASVSGSGDIHYTGNATVVKQAVSGSGEITKF